MKGDKRFHRVTATCSCGRVGELTIIASNPCTLEIREPTWGEALEALGASLTKVIWSPIMKTLTEPEIKALSGWELAAAVQEIVFGDKVSWQKPCSGSERKPYIKNRRNLWELIPAYHSDGNAMLALKEKLAMDGRTVRVETFRQCGSPENIINYVDVMVDTTLNCVKADREPTALCRAALLAYMKKGEV